MGWFQRLKQGLKRTAQLLQTDIRDLFRSGEILSEQHLERFEARLLQTDMGVLATNQITANLRTSYLGRTVQVEEIWANVKETIRSLLKGDGTAVWDSANPLSPLRFAETGPTVILVAGVNGTGKTTSIAKIANLLIKGGKKITLAAGDTFRAAAVEQLTLWAGRLGCDIVTKPHGSDPAAVAFAGCEAGVANQSDVILIDTAGRLHNQQNLMQELEKIHRVVAKRIDGAPHESLLVIDATTGQNGLAQAKHFSQAVACTGLVLTKLDGTAKGGVTVAIRQQLGLPVKYVGVGEQIDDLQLFNADEFVDALFDA